MPQNVLPYLTLDAEIEAQIADDLANGRKHPNAFDDACVVRREYREHDEATIARPAFERDIDKIMNLPAYNRYADKTQVFSFAENDDISRRGLHVQLVSRVARTIGRLLGLNTSLIEAIALGHDLGHTPFGHAGERYLSECYHARTGRDFRHNVQSVRVMDKLYRRNISLQVLDGAICHNGEFAQKELLTSDVSTFEELDSMVEACTADAKFIKTLRPATLEGCVVRVSDMIAYLGKDRQDALRMKAIDSLDAFESHYIGVENTQIINNMTVDIVNNSYGKDKICMSEAAFADLVKAKSDNYQLIYNREGMEDGHKDTVKSMFAEMYEVLLDQALERNPESPLMRHHVKQLCKQSRTINEDEYLSLDPNMVVVDYISSMTDSYFMSLYKHLFPESEKTIYTRGYCDRL